ncbi:hypothetical protein SBA4_1430014 [Candidatus Sulfopaludibacter sp. SbA4]|nr:hypothetical protein SBA4_1430014 [Candidatus Sulfopaludibacter sp. SbA4]
MTPEERFEYLDIKLRNISDILAETAAMNAETAAQSRKTEAILRRAIRLGVREARAERERRRIADDRLGQMIARLDAAQLVTEEKLQRFLESRTHHNGGNPDPTSPPAA